MSKSVDSYRRETAFPFFPQFKHEGEVVFSGKVFSTQSLQEEKLQWAGGSSCIGNKASWLFLKGHA